MAFARDDTYLTMQLADWSCRELAGNAEHGAAGAVIVRLEALFKVSVRQGLSTLGSGRTAPSRTQVDCINGAVPGVTGPTSGESVLGNGHWRIFLVLSSWSLQCRMVSQAGLLLIMYGGMEMWLDS